MATGTKTAHDTDDPLLEVILEEMRAVRTKLDALTEAQGKTALKVELMHTRSIAVFGSLGSNGGAFGRLKTKVDRHEKYINGAVTLLVAIPFIGGVLAWAIDHLAPGTIRGIGK
ncbi:MAG: hypothetical protein JWO13_2293 [Acidobacteriales bacterium]|nr:hypothetical protein [Terriglobales bacterium]